MLGWMNLAYFVVLGVFQFMQSTSEQFIVTLLTYVPLAIQVIVLAYAIYMIKNSMYHIIDAVP